MYPLVVNTICLSEDITAIFQCSWGPTSKQITSAPRFFPHRPPLDAAPIHVDDGKPPKKTCSYKVHGSKSWETNWNHFFYTVQQLINFKNDMSILHEKTSIISDPMEKQTIACHTHKQIKELLRSSSKTSQLHCLTPELKAYTSWVLRQTPALGSQWVHVDGNGASLIIWNKCMFNLNPPKVWKFEPLTTNKRRGRWSLNYPCRLQGLGKNDDIVEQTNSNRWQTQVEQNT